MSFCTFSKEFDLQSYTAVDNKFINSYVPEATGDAVKVYLFGLHYCKNGEDVSLHTFAKDLKLDEETVKDCFRYWEEFGLTDIVSDEPFLVKYLPISSLTPKKYNPEKYTAFNKSLQVLIPDRMITTSEYSAYFSVMEEFSVKPEAMLMIVKYCVDLKGPAVPFRYVLKVAQDFAQRGISTVAKIEKELSDYNLRTGDVAEVLKIVSPDKKPEIEDGKLYEKWTEKLKFDKAAILYAAERSKSRSTQKLDRELDQLFSAKKFSIEEIKDYYDNKTAVHNIATDVAKQLGVYIEIYDPFIENYVYPWLNMGYDGETLSFIAKYCFKKNRKTFVSMDDTVRKFYDSGLIAMEAIAEYVRQTSLEDEFIRLIFNAIGSSRRPTDWDRKNLKTWRSWNFSDEMILKAAELSAGKNVSYINVILSAWRSENVFTPDKIPLRPQRAASATTAFHSRKYTKEELDSLIDNLDDIDF